MREDKNIGGGDEPDDAKDKDKKFGSNEEPEGAKDHHEEDSLNELYKAVLMELNRHPHNRSSLPDAQIVTKGNNPVCGDRVIVFGKLDSTGKFERVTFEGKACSICTASASMMTDLMAGKTLKEAGALADHFKAMMRNEVPFETPPELPDMEALEGVRKFAIRVKCATLAWTTLKNGIVEYQAGRHGGSTEERCDIK